MVIVNDAVGSIEWLKLAVNNERESSLYNNNIGLKARAQRTLGIDSGFNLHEHQ